MRIGNHSKHELLQTCLLALVASSGNSTVSRTSFYKGTRIVNIGRNVGPMHSHGIARLHLISECSGSSEVGTFAGAGIGALLAAESF